MDFFSQINKVGKLEASYLPVTKLTDLSLEKDYRVTGVRSATTKFGARIIVDLDNVFSCFLPARYAKAFAENTALLEQMVQKAKDGTLLMHYEGGQYNKVEFKPICTAVKREREIDRKNMEYDAEAQPRACAKLHPLLLSIEHWLNTLSTKSVSVGLHIGHHGHLQPIIKFTSRSEGWAVMDSSAWEGFQKHFASITEYFAVHGTGEENMHLHTIISDSGYILAYENLHNTPFITLQNTFQHDGSFVQTSRPFFRFDSETFTKMALLQSILNCSLSSCHLVRQEAELCQKILIDIIAANVSEPSARRIKNIIHAKRTDIREMVQQQFQSDAIAFYLGSQYQICIIEELMVFHNEHIVHSVILHKKKM